MQYIFFDLDGTLIDTKGDIEEVLKYTMESLGFSAKPIPNSLLGASLRDIVTCLYPFIIKEKQEAILQIFRSTYDSKDYLLSYLYPGVYETITFLSNHGYKMFVVTMKPALPTRRILDQKGILNLFITSYSPDSWQGAKLGKAEIIKRVMIEFNISPDDAVYVGDQLTDICAAREAGIKSITARYGYGNPDDFIKITPITEIFAPRDLLEILDIGASLI